MIYEEPLAVVGFYDNIYETSGWETPIAPGTEGD